MPQGDFDPSHYRRIHHHLFQDVYAWAGQYRTVRASKAGNSFCYPEYIQDQMAALFDRFGNGRRFAERETTEFVSLISEFLSELNAIHPFREGNGRAQLAFIGLLGDTFGHPFNFERLDRDGFLPAMVASFSGQMTPLIHELTNLLI
ncbi:MAG: Fic family protein [Acidobacteriaceae bacterium]